MLLTTKYIDDAGFIKNVRYKLSHNITNNDQLKLLNDSILPSFNDTVLVLRGISDFEPIITTPSTLKTGQYKVDINTNGFNFKVLPEPAFGSAVECITNNLQMTTQIECQKLQSYFDSIRIKLVPEDVKSDAITVLLNEVRSNGIITHQYELQFQFNDDWSPTCQTCQTGMQYLNNELSKLSNELYAAKDAFSIEGRIITDLSVNNISVLKEEIKLLLANALTNARVRDFQINDLTNVGETVDEEAKTGGEQTI